MSSKTFTTSGAVDAAKEKDWPASLGMLDWDSTRIVFTKRKLLEFLKYIDVTVDPNFSNICKLPRYAEFMDLTTGTEDETSIQEDHVQLSPGSATDSVKPSRRVRTAPGGATSDIFGLQGTDDDALSLAPPPRQLSTEISSKEVESHALISEEQPRSNVKPSRRVRTAPGGKDSLSEMWGSVDNEEIFKPSRRVRQIPGGQDNLSGIL